MSLSAETFDFEGRFLLRTSVLASLRRESAGFPLSETGGILLGYQIEEADLVVTQATGPGPNAGHRRSSFEPDTAYCQARLNAIHKATNGSVSYIGEWHTHPLGDTRPSRQDYISMLKIANDPSFRQPAPLLWIFRPQISVLAWRWTEDWSIGVLDVKI